MNNNSEYEFIYQSDIAPLLRAHEVYRRKNAVKFICWYVFSFIVVLASFAVIPIVVFLYSHDTILVSLSFAFMFLGILLAIFICGKTRSFEKKFLSLMKKQCLPQIMKSFGNIKWDKQQRVISDSELNKSGLFADYTNRTIDDEFTGSYKGVNFKICETQLLFETNMGRSRGYVNVFKGVVMSFSLNKTTENRTMVSTKGDLTKKNTFWLYLIPLLSILQAFKLEDWESFAVAAGVILFVTAIYILINRCKFRDNMPLNRVNLEDPKFSKKFDVYSSDQIDARYFVTPAFMERFQNLKSAFGAKKAKCSFYEDKLMIAITTNKNLFEIGQMYKTLENPDTIKTFYKELSSIYDMIEYFKLDENIHL